MGLITGLLVVSTVGVVNVVWLLDRTARALEALAKKDGEKP
jgi:hypothetical protein